MLIKYWRTTMQAKFNPSVNIIRDSERNLDYISTPNATQIASQIGRDYKKGIHSFTIIGSYGTGKSSFLMALDESLTGKGVFNVNLGIKCSKVESLKIVGHYQSLIEYFRELLHVTEDFSGNQKIFDELFSLTKNNDLLVIYLDEFGKFLEYGSKHNPEKELYFIQQLAEFVNDHNRDILLVSTLHQNFEAYAANIAEDSQKKEWRKVKGRFKELTFNEPVEQLLYLAAKKLNGKNINGVLTSALAKEKHLLPFAIEGVAKIENELAPLDLISAAVLTKALQFYGQNERSLFTFLESDIESEEWVGVPKVYDYLMASFYSFLNSSYNVHFRNWRGIQAGIERLESDASENRNAHMDLFKTIGLLQLFAHKSGHVDAEMLIQYFAHQYSKVQVTFSLQVLEKKSLVKYQKFNNSYKVIEGTDVDFDLELIKAEDAVDRSFDIISALTEHFDFPIIQAKSISYNRGTPRLFGFDVSLNPIQKKIPEGAIDGFVNLVFNDSLTIDLIREASSEQEEAILYGFFNNSKSIQDHIFEILKTKKVLVDHQEDLVAKSEFEKILESHERKLSHEVLGSLYSNRVSWFFKGKEIKNINGPKKLNTELSIICENIYDSTPRFNNELINKHKISNSIHTARRLFFQQLNDHWQEKGLGFSDSKFPPEKTIYQSILLSNGMHNKSKNGFELTAPNSNNGFDAVWACCENFLESSREEKINVIELLNTLSARPFKLKQGLIDFWVPIFLFIKRGDFALYEDGKFIPYINDAVMYMLTRQPKRFTIKAFEISGLRLKVFNRYREFLEQDQKEDFTQDSFIESVRPFLMFYKTLSEYSKNTTRISVEAIALRNSIVDAQDPEKTFFETIPAAMKIDISSIEDSDKKLADFAVKLNDSIQELKNSYNELLDRIEDFLTLEVLGKKENFTSYKKRISNRYSEIKEHRLLAKQKSFIARLNSPLNDRDSWLASIAQNLLNKPLDTINDSEEEILKDRLQSMMIELDNLQALHKIKSVDGEKVYKLDITSEDGTRTTNIRIDKGSVEKVNQTANELDTMLGKNKKIRLAILSELLKKEISK